MITACVSSVEPLSETRISISREVCASLRDYVSKELFDELIKDEESHINFLEAQLRLLETIGAERYGQLNAGPASDQID